MRGRVLAKVNLSACPSPYQKLLELLRLLYLLPLQWGIGLYFQKSRKQILIQEQKGSPQNFPQKILFYKHAIRNM